MKNVFFLAVILASVASAQNGGSIASRFGIGDLGGFVTARQRAMGGSGVALLSTHDISQINPAAWSTVTGFRLQGDVSWELESYSKNSNLSYSDLGVKGLVFSIPLEELVHSRLVAGFLPVSRVGYKVQASGMERGEAYTVNYSGNGGISIFTVGTSVHPLPFFSIGAAYRYYLGTIDHEQEVAFNNGTYFGTRQTQSSSHGGSGAQIGALLELPGNITFGISWTVPSTLHVTQNLVLSYATNDSTLTGASGSQDMPASVAAGFGWAPDKDWLVTAEYRMQNWQNASIYDQPAHLLATTSRFGAGVEWHPQESGVGGGTFHKTILRMGFYRQTGYVRLNSNQESETFLTTGIGIPIFSQNRADIALEYGWRGSSDSFLGSRSLLRLSFSVSVGENWFVRHEAE